MTKRWSFVAFAILALVVLGLAFEYFWIKYEVNQAEKRLAHEMKVFALAYHEMAQSEGQLTVDEAGVVKIDWQGRPGPANLDDMAIVEAHFPELAKRIRQGTFSSCGRRGSSPPKKRTAGSFSVTNLGLKKRAAGY